MVWWCSLTFTIEEMKLLWYNVLFISTSTPLKSFSTVCPCIDLNVPCCRGETFSFQGHIQCLLTGDICIPSLLMLSIHTFFLQLWSTILIINNCDCCAYRLLKFSSGVDFSRPEVVQKNNDSHLFLFLSSSMFHRRQYFINFRLLEFSSAYRRQCFINFKMVEMVVRF